MRRLSRLLCELRESLSEAVKWKGNKATSKHTQAVIKKARSGWEVVVSTGWGKPHHLETDGTIYKSEAKERAEEIMLQWDKDIERQGRDAYD